MLPIDEVFEFGKTHLLWRFVPLPLDSALYDTIHIAVTVKITKGLVEGFFLEER